MDLTKLPKDLREKYEDKVLDKAIEKTDYDLAKHNKSQDDISEKKYESMVARNIEVIKSAYKEKAYKTGFALTGIPFIINIAKGNIAAAFGFGDEKIILSKYSWIFTWSLEVIPILINLSEIKVLSMFSPATKEL